MKKYPVRQVLNQSLPDFAALKSPIHRKRLSFLTSLLIHALIILGLGFTATSGQPRPAEPLILELTLTGDTKEKPVDTRLLAQHDRLGSGTHAEEDKTHNPLPALSQQLHLRKSTTTNDSASAEPVRSEILLLDPNTQPRMLSLVTVEQSLAPDSGRIEYSRAMTLISQYADEVDDLKQQSSDISRHTFISSSTRESRYAAYVEAWRNRVETVGNLHYPELARQHKLSGQLLMDVAIDPDGLVRSIRVLRSSGVKILDEAAIHITALAAPFEPLPNEVRRDTDVLHITRTWHFQENARLIHH